MIKINAEKHRQFLAGQVRKQRDERLSSSDGKMATDSPFDKAAWSTYRQNLRNITEQEGFPEKIIWPIEPR
ncbi:tail fiber assembly protein [Pectobacterium wasabiae]|uniref:tail fiber assembly protein n=1 Tax=Pectobacterium wasabiae TaxID=55208 RepID=UPI0002D37A7E|nr:tail fiber assembly protein [Pectobacterium wasabiae]AOR65099.1 hypothetical protein A7983_17905 [Pectobacterium wasabiae CFBP 3304]